MANLIWGVVIGLGVAGVSFMIYCKCCCKKCDCKLSKTEEKKAENFKKIVDFIADKDKFSNDDLEKLLGVSNTTTKRYLDELEASGKIVQHGDIGTGVYYTKK